MQDSYAVEMVEFTQLNITSDGDNEESKTDLDDWNEIFAQLDPEDGRICKDAFLEWIDTLNFQSTVMLEANQGIPRCRAGVYVSHVLIIFHFREKIRWLIETADTDDDKHIDRKEFLALVEKYSRELEKIERNNFLKYMRVAAYADEYRWWPPPFFIILPSFFIFTECC